MRKTTWFAMLLAAIFGLAGQTTYAKSPLFGNDEIQLRDEKKFPEAAYLEFLSLPRVNVGFLDLILDRHDPRCAASIVMADLRGPFAVFFFRGMPGGGGFAIPEDRPYQFREYVLEVRWIDEAGALHFWWNSEKLDRPLVERPELAPLAPNSPF